MNQVATDELLCLKDEWLELSKFKKIYILGAVLYLGDLDMILELLAAQSGPNIRSCGAL